MKIDTRNIERVMRDIGSWRGVLFYGEDTGLVRERALAAVHHIVENIDDPFRVARLEVEQQHYLEEEALALSLVGGRRVVWVRDAQENVVPLMERILKKESDTLIVLEGKGLSPRSKLRIFAEKSKQIATIACYPEKGHVLSRTVTDALAEDRIQISRDGLAWLLGHLGNNRSLVRGEIEKLRLYAGHNSRLSLDDVLQCVGDSGGSSLDDAIYAAFSGDRLRADRAFERALLDGGANPISFVRVLLNIVERLQQVCLATDAGQSRIEAMASLRPPVFFRQKEAFLRTLERWSYDALVQVAYDTQQLEWECKQSRSISNILLCRRHLVRLCYPQKV